MNKLVLGVCLFSTLALGHAVAAEAPNSDEAIVSDEEHPIVREARKLDILGETNQALEELSDYIALHPDDVVAKRLYDDIRIRQKRAELQSLAQTRASKNGYILPSAEYSKAKARSSLAVSDQLNIVEFLIDVQNYTEAVEKLEQIRDDHPYDEATVTLLHRTLDFLVVKESEHLEREQNISLGRNLNDVIRSSRFPNWRPPIPRTVIIFEEDIAEMKRRQVLSQLQIPVRYLKGDDQPLEAVLKTLFNISGLNFMIQKDLLTDETLDIDIVDVPVGDVLKIIQRQVPIHFNFLGNAVFVTNEDEPILVTEIIRLKNAGLTNVKKPVEVSANAGGGGGGGAGGGPGGGAGGGNPFDNIPNIGGPSNADDEKSDLVRLLEAIRGEGNAVSEPLVNLPDGSTMYLDEKINAVIVKSSPAAISEVRRLINYIDRPAIQVLVEAKFVEVRASAMENWGVNWQIVGDNDVSNPNNNIFFGAARGANAINPLGADPSTLANGLATNNGGLLAGIIGTGRNHIFNYSVTLEMMSERGDVNVLSEPKILTLNNSPGAFVISREIAYVEDYTSRNNGRRLNNVDNGLNNNNNNIFQDTVLVPDFGIAEESISLQVIPSVAYNDDLIYMEINPTIRELIGFRDSGDQSIAGDTTVLGSAPIQQPEFSERQISTKLQVRNGQTIVLGGLIEETHDRNRRGIPGIQDVPGLGRLFRSDSKSLDRGKLMIFISAHIIDPQGVKYSDEVQHLREITYMTLDPDTKAAMREKERMERDRAKERASVNSQIRNRPRAGKGGR